MRAGTGETRPRQCARRPWRGLVLVLAAALTLVGWSLATPVGSSPDDEYHLISTWCAGPDSAGLCDPGSAADHRTVPDVLRGIACYYGPETSAACQEELDWSLQSTVDTDRGNFHGEYPPVYYAVHGVLAGADIQLSALLMRLLNVVVFLGLATGLWLLLPQHRRPALVWGWLATTIPLGVFLIASNNPSSWAIVGVGTAWLALLGYYETEGRRRIGLGVLFALAVLLAAGSRGDAALYVGFAIVIAAILAATRTRRFLLASILPVAMGLVALAFFLASRQVGSGLGGFSSGGTASDAPELSGLALLAYNILNLPLLWTGLLADAGLGRLDVQLPAVVVFGVVAVFVALGFAGIVRMTRRKALALVLVLLVVTALPLYVLQAGGHSVGQVVQPRYLLPLGVLLAGLLLLTEAGRPLRLTRLQGWLVGLALIGIHFVALQITIRRYVTGIDQAGFSLDAGAEWWWTGMPGPNTIWIGASAAFAVVVALAVPLLTRPADAVPEVASEAPGAASPSPSAAEHPA